MTNDDWEAVMGWIAITIIGVGMVVLVGWGAVEDAKKWEAYKVANHCQEKGYIDSSVGVGYTSAGKGGIVTTYTPGKTRYVCDNDVEIFR